MLNTFSNIRAKSSIVLFGSVVILMHCQLSEISDALIGVYDEYRTYYLANNFGVTISIRSI